MFFICKNRYFTKIARKGIHFLFNGKNVEQFCDVFMQKRLFCTVYTTPNHKNLKPNQLIDGHFTKDVEGLYFKTL